MQEKYVKAWYYRINYIPLHDNLINLIICQIIIG